MANFFRNPLIKTLLAILCVLSLTAGVCSGAAVGVLLYSGSFTGEGNLFGLFAEEQLREDADRIMYNYFDPMEPTKPWQSYWSGGIYTGEDSNFIYNVVSNTTGYSVLSTVEGGEPICHKWEHTYYFETAVEGENPGDYILTEWSFACGNLTYLYSAEQDYFYPVQQHVSEAEFYLPDDIYENGFSVPTDLPVEYTWETASDSAPVVAVSGGYVHYGYDGVGFYPTRQWEDTGNSSEMNAYTITCYLLEGLPYEDGYRRAYEISGILDRYQNELVAALVSCALLFILTLVLLCCSLGWVKGKEEPVVSFLFKLPAELAVVVATAGFGVILSILLEELYLTVNHLWINLMLVVLLVAGMALCLVYLVSYLAVRGKTGTFLSGSVIYWLLTHIGELLRRGRQQLEKGLQYLPLVWKVMVCYAAICGIEFCGLMIGRTEGEGVLIWFLLRLMLGALVMYAALALRRLKKGAESIASGDYTTRVDDKYLVMDFKETADTLNHIQDGMNVAVESRMKSERLKTELITNVSHDLKTPLTSIVSYVDLLKQEPAGSQAAEEYLEVLDRQSARLKKLIEDLVEASKASTGNIPMTKEPLDFSMVLGQALGEYRERMDNAGLIPVLKLPEEPAVVEADGRLLWRVFDNLLGNIVKYAMPGTRVYLTVEVGNAVSATFRNISREALDVTAEELMERFVRGDASRHTEGSGLGLSIARSLTESMGGEFSLQLDGDLFKATVAFPICDALF